MHLGDSFTARDLSWAGDSNGCSKLKEGLKPLKNKPKNDIINRLTTAKSGLKKIKIKIKTK
jgi:hypothetical protein